MTVSTNVGGGQAGAAEASNTKPVLCENCELREPVALTASPTLVGKAGLPLDIWLCGACLAKVPKTPRKKKRKTKGRLTTGRYGTTLMRLAYRFGGFTARQLGEFLLLENPKRFYREGTPGSTGDEEAKARALASATHAGHKHLTLLRDNGLMRSVGVWREHVYGQRDGRIEEFYRLHGEGVAWGGSLNEIGDTSEAGEAYQRHQLPRRAEHAAYRNDIYLRMLSDMAVERGYESAKPSGEQDASYIVRSGSEAFSGESWEGYPYQVGPFRNKAGKEVPSRGRKYEWLYPDGHPTLEWGDGLMCAFEVEAERESWAKQASRKVDRYAAYWLRLYKLHESDVKEPERGPLAAELREKEARRKEVLEVEGRKTIDGKKHPELDSKGLRDLRIQIAEIENRDVPFSGLPDGIAPVVFVHPTATRSATVRKALRARQYPMPRYDEMVAYLTPLMRRWAADELLAITEGRGEGVASWGGGSFDGEDDQSKYARCVLESLFIFTSWDTLQPSVKRNLSTGEVYEVDEIGGTLEEVYAPLAASGTSEGALTSLRATAELWASLRPSHAVSTKNTGDTAGS